MLILFINSHTKDDIILCIIVNLGIIIINILLIRHMIRSVDSVVFPVPESPKKIAVFSQFKSVLAEQCMEELPFNGR